MTSMTQKIASKMIALASAKSHFPTTPEFEAAEQSQDICLKPRLAALAVKPASGAHVIKDRPFSSRQMKVLKSEKAQVKELANSADLNAGELWELGYLLLCVVDCRVLSTRTALICWAGLSNASAPVIAPRS